MKKFLVASASAIALFGLAACSDNTDTTTTQGLEPDVNETQPVAPAEPDASPLDDQPPVQPVQPVQ